MSRRDGRSGLPTLSRHSHILVHRRYIAVGMEKVRPGTGREVGLGHAGSDEPKARISIADIHQVMQRHYP